MFISVRFFFCAGIDPQPLLPGVLIEFDNICYSVHTPHEHQQQQQQRTMGRIEEQRPQTAERLILRNVSGVVRPGK